LLATHSDVEICLTDWFNTEQLYCLCLCTRAKRSTAENQLD